MLHSAAVVVDVVVVTLLQQLADMPPATPPLTTSPFTWDHQCHRTIARRLAASW